MRVDMQREIAFLTLNQKFIYIYAFLA